MEGRRVVDEREDLAVESPIRLDGVLFQLSVVLFVFLLLVEAALVNDLDGELGKRGVGVEDEGEQVGDQSGEVVVPIGESDEPVAQLSEEEFPHGQFGVREQVGQVVDVVHRLVEGLDRHRVGVFESDQAFDDRVVMFPHSA